MTRTRVQDRLARKSNQVPLHLHLSLSHPHSTVREERGDDIAGRRGDAVGEVAHVIVLSLFFNLDRSGEHV